MSDPRPSTPGGDLALERISSSAPRLLDDAGAAELLSVPKSWVAAEARADRIPHVRFGHYRRFDEEVLIEWWRTRMARGPKVRTGSRPVSQEADRP